MQRKAKQRQNIGIGIYSIILLAFILFFHEEMFFNPGFLTWPGIIITIVCMALLQKNRIKPVVILSSVAATSSLIAQSFLGICSPCLLIAGLFTIGIIYLAQLDWSLIPILAGAALLLFITPVPQTDRPVLYIALNCPSCKPIAQELINIDPGGKAFTIAIPASQYQEGIKEVRMMGFAGSIIKGNTDIVPTLTTSGARLEGDREIQEYIDRQQKSYGSL